MVCGYFSRLGQDALFLKGNLKTAIKRKKTIIEGAVRFVAFGSALSYLRKRFFKFLSDISVPLDIKPILKCSFVEVINIYE